LDDHLDSVNGSPMFTEFERMARSDSLALSWRAYIPHANRPASLDS